MMELHSINFKLIIVFVLYWRKDGLELGPRTSMKKSLHPFLLPSLSPVPPKLHGSSPFLPKGPGALGPSGVPH